MSTTLSHPAIHHSSIHPPAAPHTSLHLLRSPIHPDNCHPTSDSHPHPSISLPAILSLHPGLQLPVLPPIHLYITLQTVQLSALLHWTVFCCFLPCKSARKLAQKFCVSRSAVTDPRTDSRPDPIGTASSRRVFSSTHPHCCHWLCLTQLSSKSSFPHISATTAPIVTQICDNLRYHVPDVVKFPQTEISRPSSAITHSLQLHCCTLTQHFSGHSL